MFDWDSRTLSQIPLFFNVFQKLYHIKIKADSIFGKSKNCPRGTFFLIIRRQDGLVARTWGLGASRLSSKSLPGNLGTVYP